MRPSFWTLTRRELLSRLTSLPLFSPWTGGALAGAGVISTGMGACSTELDTAASKLPMLIAIASERIIPETDTPGAIRAGVSEYIARLMTEGMLPEARAEFTAYLMQFDQAARIQFKADFLTLSPEQQTDIILAMETGESGIAAQTAIAAFKYQVLWAYYSSEAGAQELIYEPLPGAYDGCVAFSEIGRPWAIVSL